MQVRYILKGEVVADQSSASGPAILDSDGKNVECNVCFRGYMREIYIGHVTKSQIKAAKERSRKETIACNRSYGGRKGHQSRRESREDTRQYGTRLMVGFSMLRGALT